jgi:nitroreductase
MQDISRATIERLIAAAHRAPSVDNCQPWTFRWNGHELAIHHDAERARNVLDHCDHLSYLTLGCVLESITIAARAEGLKVEERPCPEGGAAAPWATLVFKRGRSADDALLHALHARYTERRLYRPGPVRREVLETLRRKATRHPSSGIHFITDFPIELVDYMVRADAYPWRHPDVYRDIMRWVRFSERELANAGDGAAWQALGLNVPDIPGLHLTRSDLARRFADCLRLYSLSALFLRAQISSSSALICVTTRRSGRDVLVQAGRTALSLWLRLNQIGWAAQPFTLASTMVYNHATCGLPENTLPEFVALFGRGRNILQRAFGFRKTELPVWLFRAGPAPDTLPATILRTPRLPLSRILHFTETCVEPDVSGISRAKSKRA